MTPVGLPACYRCDAQQMLCLLSLVWAEYLWSGRYNPRRALILVTYPRQDVSKLLYIYMHTAVSDCARSTLVCVDVRACDPSHADARDR